MAKEYDLRNIAVVEKGWLGGGNTGRNTTGPIVLIAGNTFRHSIPGGGGYGNPLERDPALILEDVLDGKVSAYQALSHYGVVIKAIGVTGTDFIVDELATAKARQASIT
jgi:N-methylhydantoinase B/oxoprolinase/acetone carboxylase alpha subunit